MVKHAHPKRRNKLPQPRLQLRMVGAFAGLCILALLTQILVLGALLTRLANTLPAGGRELGIELPGLLTNTFLISLVLLLPALLLIGIRITFRIAGPLFRFERHLESVASGEWPGHCQIRQSDDMQKFCKSLNGALDSAREQGRREGAEAEAEEQERPKRKSVA